MRTRVRAQIGRTLLPSDEVAPGRHPVIVLSDGRWRRDFGADPDIVGKTVEVNSHVLTVVGVADSTFHGTIVSYDVEVLAQRFWGGAEAAIGKAVRVGNGDWRTVIGVAGDVKYARIDEAPRPYLYLPFLQAYRSSMVLHTRGRGSVDRLVEQARARVAALDPDLPILSAKPLADETRAALIFFDLTATMLFVFGAAGMGLAAIGMYGLMSYTVTQSTHEIGIRLALGASGLSVVRRFLGHGLRLGAAGAALGMLAALGAGRLLGSFLFGASPIDGTSFARALAIVLGGVIIAALVPAWRAARTNPLRALRHQ